MSDSENAFRDEKKVKRFSARIREFLPPPRRLCSHWRWFIFLFIVCLLAGLPKNYLRWKEDTWTREETIRFWW